MISEAEKDGSLKPGDTLIEATSGNTGPYPHPPCPFHCVLSEKVAPRHG